MYLPSGSLSTRPLLATAAYLTAFFLLPLLAEQSIDMQLVEDTLRLVGHMCTHQPYCTTALHILQSEGTPPCQKYAAAGR